MAKEFVLSIWLKIVVTTFLILANSYDMYVNQNVTAMMRLILVAYEDIYNSFVLGILSLFNVMLLLIAFQYFVGALDCLAENSFGAADIGA